MACHAVLLWLTRVLVGGGEHFTARRGSVDGGGNPDNRNQLHHDFLEHLSRQIGRDAAQRAFDLLGLLPKNFLDVPVIPRPAIGIGLHHGLLICVTPTRDGADRERSARLRGKL